MNPEHLLNDVERAIANRPPSHRKRYHLVWANRQIQCIPSGDPRPREISFGTFHVDHLTKGFTSQQWNQLQTAIRTFLLQKGLL